jgi:DNA transposition AAA+ family ATPase
MNNAQTFPVDVEQEREWLAAHKAEKGYSWSRIASLSAIPSGTISTFMTRNYAGNNENVARKIFQYRQMIESQADREIAVPDFDPGYFETATSTRLISLMVWAHRGRMTLAATGPGTGKTRSIQEYRDSTSNVWVVTMDPLFKSVNALASALLRAVKVTNGRGGGWGAQLSQLVQDSIAGRRGLIVVDEANHCTWEQLEQLRSWHDATGVGVFLSGNEELLMRIEGDPRRDKYARLNSRIAQRHLAIGPEAGDVDAFCDAWNVTDAGMRQFLQRIALTAGSGALRECRQLIEQASLIAAADERPLSLGDLRDAQSNRSTRFIRA